MARIPVNAQMLEDNLMELIGSAIDQARDMVEEGKPIYSSSLLNLVKSYTSLADLQVKRSTLEQGGVSAKVEIVGFPAFPPRPN